MEHPELLKMADLKVLSRLLTSHVQNSRFVSGHWASLIDSGHLRAILERIKVIRGTISMNGSTSSDADGWLEQ
jgi:hypothetical protein